jgi:hypothetical protein
MIENERFGLVFVKTGSINSGTVNCMMNNSEIVLIYLQLFARYSLDW